MHKQKCNPEKYSTSQPSSVFCLPTREKGGQEWELQAEWKVLCWGTWVRVSKNLRGNCQNPATFSETTSWSFTLSSVFPVRLPSTAHRSSWDVGQDSGGSTTPHSVGSLQPREKKSKGSLDVRARGEDSISVPNGKKIASHGRMHVLSSSNRGKAMHSYLGG
jgi:hypothetical protein